MSVTLFFRPHTLCFLIHYVFYYWWLWRAHFFPCLLVTRHCLSVCPCPIWRQIHFGIIYPIITFPIRSLNSDMDSAFKRLMWYHPIITRLSLSKCIPFSGFLKKSANISSVGKYSILRVPLFNLSFTPKYLMLMFQVLTSLHHSVCVPKFFNQTMAQAPISPLETHKFCSLNTSPFQWRQNCLDGTWCIFP